MEIDITKWSGEGEFTGLIIERLKQLAGIDAIRVEDAPASRSDAIYNFISNEVFVTFAVSGRPRLKRRRYVLFGFLTRPRAVARGPTPIASLEALLTEIPEVGAPDYSDEGMLQYLRTERIVPPYQTRGYKLIELVRIYEADAAVPAR